MYLFHRKQMLEFRYKKFSISDPPRYNCPANQTTRKSSQDNLERILLNKKYSFSYIVTFRKSTSLCGKNL